MKSISKYYGNQDFKVKIWEMRFCSIWASTARVGNSFLSQAIQTQLNWIIDTHTLTHTNKSLNWTFSYLKKHAYPSIYYILHNLYPAAAIIYFHSAPNASWYRINTIIDCTQFCFVLVFSWRNIGSFHCVLCVYGWNDKLLGEHFIQMVHCTCFVDAHPVFNILLNVAKV